MDHTWSAPNLSGSQDSSSPQGFLTGKTPQHQNIVHVFNSRAKAQYKAHMIYIMVTILSIMHEIIAISSELLVLVATIFNL